MKLEMTLTAFFLIVLYVAASGLYAGNAIKPLPLYDRQIPLETPERGLDESCYWLGYHGDPDYFISFSDAPEGVAGCSMRFSVNGPESLMTARFLIYDPGDGTFGDDDVYVSVYDDNGIGFPGTLLVKKTLAAGSYPAYPSWTLVDFSSDNLVFSDDFHIAFTTDTGSGESESLLLDDGHMGAGRSCCFVDAGWTTFEDFFGLDLSYIVDVRLCKEVPSYDYYDTTWVESFFDVVYGPVPPDPGQLPDETIHLNGTFVLGWNDSYENGETGLMEIRNEISDMYLTGSSPSMGKTRLIRPPDLPASTGLATSVNPGIDFPAESFFDIYYEIEFPDVPQVIIPCLGSRSAPNIVSEIPINSMPPYYIDYSDGDYTPFVDRNDINTIAGWIKPRLQMQPEPCNCFGDPNDDGTSLTVADLVYLNNFVAFDGPPPDPMYQGDFNGDCVVDLLDVELFLCYNTYGMICFDEWPVRTCCEPDTIRGACCSVDPDSCRILAPFNCDFISGNYMGDNINCDPDPCSGVCDCIPGDANGSMTYNILDVTHIINYLYKGGPAPTPYPLCSGDANCDCKMNILDVTYIINYLYKGGNQPCTCEDWVIDCGPL